MRPRPPIAAWNQQRERQTLWLARNSDEVAEGANMVEVPIS